MKVEPGKQVTLEYMITTEKGEQIESSQGRGAPLVFNFGTDCGLPSGVTEGIAGVEEDTEVEFDVPPEKAFGTRESGPEMMLPKSAFPQDVEIKSGASFQGTMPDSDQTVEFVIVENLNDKVKVRLIHPLAGQKIHIKAKVLSVSDAED